jgi:hypothetical protein
MHEFADDALKLYRVDRHDKPRYLPAYFCSPECAVSWLKDMIIEHELYIVESKQDEPVIKTRKEGFYG